MIIGLCRHLGIRAALLVGAVLILAPNVALAQDRNSMIQSAQEAYDDFQTGRALDLLKAALDPGEGPRDSTWAHGVHLLAQIFIEEDEPALADAWLRWARRIYPDMRVDRVLFIPEVLDASDRARRAVSSGSAGDQVTETDWEWAVGRTPGTSGQMRIADSELDVPVRVLVDGRVVQEGRTATLEPGSYDIQVAADGYLATRLQREVLPGVTTVLKFNLQPVAGGPATPEPQAAETGSIMLSSNVRGASVRIVPTGRSGDPTSAGLPYTFSSEVGSYRVELIVDGQVARREEFRLEADEAQRLELLVVTQDVTGPVATEQRDGGGGFPWPLAVVGVAGAGTAAYFLLGKKPTLGGISITIPNP
ncbi:MAG: hypothetical protein OEY63_04720 [Gemmatimonadota bacterium]|nr:hypothetical protein [Gemmatimonadota bacterium]MDH5803974.1 hypothetical protein [Gemmatimonadota bacterium]